MREPPTYSIFIDKLLSDSTKRILLINDNIALSMVNSLQKIISNKGFKSIYFDAGKLIEEAIPSTTILIFSFFYVDGGLSNIFVKYNLHHCHNKIIVLCDKALLHPHLDPSLYFVPIQNGRLCKHLLIVLSMTTRKNSPLIADKQKKISQTDSMHLYRGHDFSEVKLNHYLNRQLMSHDSSLMRMLSERATTDNNFADMLIRFVYASRHDKTMQIAAANAITALNYMHYSFVGVDLSYISIPGADLSNANLDSANLSYADLSGVKLHHAWLVNCNLNESNMNDIKLMEFPILPGICAQYSFDKKYLAVLDKSDDIITLNIYAASSLEKLDKIKLCDHTIRKIFYTYILSFINSIFHFIILKKFNIYFALLIAGAVGAIIGHLKTAYNIKLDSKKYMFENFLDQHTLLAWHNSKYQLAVACPTQLQLFEFDNNSSKKFKQLNHIKAPTVYINAVAANPHTDDLAIGAISGEIILWNMHTGSYYQIINHQTSKNYSAVFFLDYSPLGDLLAACLLNGIIKLYKMPQGILMETHMKHEQVALCLKFNLNGKQLATSGLEGFIYVWNLEFNTFQQLEHRGGAISLLFQTESILLSGGRDSTIRQWDLKTSTCLNVIRQNSNSIRSLSLNTYGEDLLLLSSSLDNTVHLQSITDNSSSHNTCQYSKCASYLNFILSDQYLVWVNHKTVSIFDISFKRILYTKQLASEIVNMSFDESNKQLVIVDKGGTIQWLTYNTFLENQSYTLGVNDLKHIAFNLYLNAFLFSENNISLRYFDVLINSYLTVYDKLESCKLSGIYFDKHSQQFIVAYENGHVIFLNRNCSSCSIFCDVGEKLYSLAVDAKNQKLITGSFSLCFWNLVTCKLDKKINSHKWQDKNNAPFIDCGGIINLRLRPNSHQLLSGGNDRMLRLWCTRTFACIKEMLIGHEAHDFAWSANGLLLAVTIGEKVVIYNISPCGLQWKLHISPYSQRLNATDASMENVKGLTSTNLLFFKERKAKVQANNENYSATQANNMSRT